MKQGIQARQLITILKLSIAQGLFIKATAVYIDKNDYTGAYLKDIDGNLKNPTKFRHFTMKKLLEFHFAQHKPQSKEIELVIDRFQRGQEKEQQLKNYLNTFAHFSFYRYSFFISQVDSRYVELVQVADWIAGCVKEKHFVHTERKFEDLFDYIKINQIKS